MAVPTHFKFVIGGLFKGTEETWSYSLKYERQVPASPDAGLDDVDKSAFVDVVTAFHELAVFPSSVQVATIDGYVIGTNGKMEGEPWNYQYDGTLPDGGGSSWVMPSQIALVVTSVGAERGPARFGRFYLPTPNLPLSTDGRVSESNAEGMLDYVVQYVKDLSDTIDLPDVNSSELLNISTKGTGGTKQVVDKLRLGRVLDTQRRRRRQLEESYVSSGTIDW